MRPAPCVLLGRFEIALRLFGQEPRDHAHGKLDGDFAGAALLELLAEPAIDLLISGLEADGDPRSTASVKPLSFVGPGAN